MQKASPSPLAKQADPGLSLQAGATASSIAAPSNAAPEAVPRGSLGLPMSPQVSPSELCTMLRLPTDAISYATLAAMMGERLPLDQASAQIIRRFARRHHDDPAAARLAARALAAGLGSEVVSGSFLSAVMDVVLSGNGHGSGDSGGDGRNQTNDGTGGEDSDTPAHESTDGSGGDAGAGSGGAGGSAGSRAGHRGGTAKPEGNEDVEILRLSKALQDGLKGVLLDPEMLSLSVPGKDGSGWVCVPFDISIKGVSLHGFFRIWYYSYTRVGRMVVDVRFGEERRLFELAELDGEHGIVYYSNDETENAAFVAEFKGRALVTSSDLDSGYARELLSRTGVVEDA
ncbi:hypothetical protein MASR2M48_30890 [Spirochaetota bacterium]